MTPVGLQQKFPSFLRQVGARIRERRKALGLSIEALALRCDSVSGFVGQVERGQKLCSLKSLYKIAAGLRTTPGDLLSVDSEDGSDNRAQELAAMLNGCSEEDVAQLFAIFREMIKFRSPIKPSSKTSRKS